MNAKEILLTTVFWLFGSSLVFSASGDLELNLAEQQRLYDGIKRGHIPFPVDVTYTRQEIVPGDIAAGKIRVIEGRRKLVAESHGLSESEVTFRPSGFFRSQSEYVVFTLERIRMEGLEKVRKDITYFSGGMNDSNIIGDVTNIYADHTFQYINKKMRTIALSDEPHFESTGTAEIMSFGKTGNNLQIIADIMITCNPNKTDDIAKSYKKKFVVETEQENASGIKSIKIKCVDINDIQKKYYELFVDPNEWGRCYKVVRYNENTGYIERSADFKDFSKAEGSDYLYPHNITITHFDDKGKEKEREVYTILDIKSGKPLEKNIFVAAEEFGDYQKVKIKRSDSSR